MLGDEFAIVSENSMFDLNAARDAYQQMKTLLDRASVLDSNGSSRSSFAGYYGRLAQIDGFIDPYQQLDDTRDGLREIALLPSEEQKTLRLMRSRIYTQMLEVDALVQLGHYTEARTLADHVVGEESTLAASDPQDQRAQLDLVAGLDRLATISETPAMPELEASPNARRRNLTAAEPALQREIAVMKTMQQSSSPQDLTLFIADAQVRLGIVQYRLRKDPAAAELAASGLASFRQICDGGHCSVMTLLYAAPDFLNAEPPSLRDPKLALQYAQRAVELTHHKIPMMLLTLARAYRANGQIDRSRATAREGLALLPPSRPHEGPTNMRRLLEKQAR